MNYRYIGLFTFFSGEVVILDPALHPLMQKIEGSSLPPLTAECISNVYTGHYIAYHMVGDEGTLCKLLLIHEGLTPDDIVGEPVAEHGMAAILMSGTVAAVDKQALFDGTKTKYLLYSDAYYDAHEIIKELPNMPYNETIKENLKNLATLAVEDGIPLLGYDIFDAIDGSKNPVWPDFCTMNSTHWGMDCCVRVHDDYRRGDVIWGGALSVTNTGGFIAYQVYRDKTTNKAYAITIDLHKEDFSNYYAEEFFQTAERISRNPLSFHSAPATILPVHIRKDGSTDNADGGIDGFAGEHVETGLCLREDAIDSSEPVFSGVFRDDEKEYAATIASKENNSDERFNDILVERDEFLGRKIQRDMASPEEIDEYFNLQMEKDDRYFGSRMDEEYRSTMLFHRNDYLQVVRSMDDLCLDDFFESAAKHYKDVQMYLNRKNKNTFLL